MTIKRTTIVNKTGLHARPASQFTREANQFNADITVVNCENGKEGNAKSIINVIAMGLVKGIEVEIRAEGDDEQQAVDALTALIDSGFGENE